MWPITGDTCQWQPKTATAGEDISGGADVDVREVLHGKTDSNSRTVSAVSSQRSWPTPNCATRSRNGRHYVIEWDASCTDSSDRRRSCVSSRCRRARDGRRRAGAAPDRDRKRRVALPGRRCRAHPLVARGSDQRRQFLRSGGGVDLAGRQLRPQPRLLQPLHADLCRRHSSIPWPLRGGRWWPSEPATGETLWTFREPETIRHLRSPRQAYGRGSPTPR